MKKVLPVFVFFFLLTPGLFSQFAWSEIIYHYQTGSVPPPYYFSYELRILSDGTGAILYYPDYAQDTVWTFAVKVTDEEINILNTAITKSNILNEQIPSLPDNEQPIGGSLQNLTIILYQDPNLDQMPMKVSTPYFPTKENTEKLDKLYGQIRSLVPESTWKEIDRRKEDSIKNKK